MVVEGIAPSAGKAKPRPGVLLFESFVGAKSTFDDWGGQQQKFTCQGHAWLWRRAPDPVRCQVSCGLSLLRPRTGDDRPSRGDFRSPLTTSRSSSAWPVRRTSEVAARNQRAYATS